MAYTSYLSPKLEARVVRGTRSVFVRERIGVGEVLTVWGGNVVTAEAFGKLARPVQRISVQIEEELFLVPTQEGPAEWVNHSCAPNAGLSGQIILVALRDLEVGEEVCYDYAMSDGSAYDEFDCGCGAQGCRKRVTGEDWRQPALWERYRGHFSPYIQQRIDQLRALEAAA